DVAVVTVAHLGAPSPQKLAGLRGTGAVERRAHRGRLAQQLLVTFGVEALGTEREPGARDRGGAFDEVDDRGEERAHAFRLYANRVAELGPRSSTRSIASMRAAS